MKLEDILEGFDLFTWHAFLAGYTKAQRINWSSVEKLGDMAYDAVMDPIIEAWNEWKKEFDLVW